MKAAIEIVADLYVKIKAKIDDTPCLDEIRSALQKFRKYASPWKDWEDREPAIRFHKYSRPRDKLRAYKRSDFTLARQLDRAKAAI